MTERWSTPSIPIKRYGREVLVEEKAEPTFTKAVIAFLDTAYWIENNIGDPDLHRVQALRRAGRFVSGEQLAAAQNTADTLYTQYKQLAGIPPDQPLTYSAISALEAIRRGPTAPSGDSATPSVRIIRTREIAERAFDRLHRIIEMEFKGKYQHLMGYTDDRLRIVNSNERVSFEKDPVFLHSDEDIQRLMQQRKLSGRRYTREQKRIAGELEQQKQLDIDPYDKAVVILELAKHPTKQNIAKLVKELDNPDAMIRDTAADALDQVDWRPQSYQELASYYMAKEDWGKVLDVGDDAIPSLLKGLVLVRELPTCQMIVSSLDELGWNATSGDLKQKVFYYSYKDDYYHLSMLGPNAIPHITEALKKGLLAYPTGTRVLQELDVVAANRALRQLARSRDKDLQTLAKQALGTFKEHGDPIYVQRLVESNQPNRLLLALQALRPAWSNLVIPPRDEFISLAEALLYLPPVGGKVEAPTDRSRYFTGALDPSMTIEEQVNQLSVLRQKGNLPQFPEGYIHQLTVQGRLPDPFKYTALALILHSPYINDWTKPFFEAPWGQIAPMIHDGGNVDPGVNPIWRWAGRTDFLQRIGTVFQTNLEQLEQLSPKELIKYSVDELARARYEQEERDRLLIEAKAYQRLALALHSKTGIAPIPKDVAGRLANHWDSFTQRMDMVLQEYDIAGVARVTWFADKPIPTHSLSGYGPRYEAPWLPIQKELIHLESVRMSHPELGSQIRQLLQEVTNNVDREIGLWGRS